MKRRWLLSGAAALGGCSVLPKVPYVEQRSWPLELRRGAVMPSNTRGRVLMVRVVRAAPGLEVRGLQSLQADGSVRIDFYEQWAVPPAQAVEDDLRQWLADAGLFSAVVAPGSRLNADFVLEGELNRFVADLNANVARVAMALVLLDQRPSPNKVLLQKTESAEVRIAGGEPPAIADGVKAALTEVLRQSERDISAAVR
jgi:cholesterol transport system auxiliary component